MSVRSSGFFEQLERRLALLSPPIVTGVKRDRVVLGVVAVGMLAALVPAGRLIGNEAAASLTLAGVLMQVCAVSVLAYRQVRDVMPDFIDAKRKFAIDMDRQFSQRAQLIEWLRSFPSEQRGMYLAYVEARLESLQSRYPLFFGAVDKLGFLPVLVGVAIQLHALTSVSFPVMIVGVWIVLLYGMAFWISGYRLQLEGYRRVMRAADDPAAGVIDVPG